MTRLVTSTGLYDEEVSLLKEKICAKFEDLKYSPNLTSDVTYLVIDTDNKDKTWLKSKKFQYVTMFRPDVDVISLHDFLKSDDYKITRPIKPFTNLKISLCRLDEDLMKKIEPRIIENGGLVAYHLSNETDILVSMIAEGRRYEAALEWGIPIVSPDWCFDSIDRGLPLSTKCYFLSKNVKNVVEKLRYIGEEDRVGHRTKVQAFNMGKRDEACDWNKLKEWRENERKRNLEDYIKTKLTDEELQKTHKFNPSVIEYDEFTTEESTVLTDDKKADNMEVKLRKKRKRLDENTSIHPIKKLTLSNDTLWNSVMNRNRESTSETSVITPIPTLFATQKPISSDKITPTAKRPVLDELKFKIVGFSHVEAQKLVKVITKFGGEVVSENETFTVVSFKYDKPVKGSNLITELSIERFIFNEKVDSGDYLWCKPFALDAAMSAQRFRSHILRSSIVPSAEPEMKLRVSITGFVGTDLSQIERLLQQKLSKWIKFEPVFTKDTELLVTGPRPGSSTSRKQELASKWDVQEQTAEVFFERVYGLSLT